MYLQEASSLFGNHEEQLLSKTGNGVRRELIFQAAVAFEKFVLRYGYRHLSKSRPDINITNSKLCEWKLNDLLLQCIDHESHNFFKD